MKKPGFIITETIFSLVLAASVAAVAVLAVDLKTNRFHIDQFNPFVQESSASAEEKSPADEKKADESTIQKESSAEASPEPSQASAGDSSKQQESKTESSTEKQDSTQESSKESSENSADTATLTLLSEPKNLKSQPKELVDMLNKYGYGLDNAIDGNRIILVDTTSGSDKTKAVVYCYQKSDKSNYWWNVVGENKPVCQDAYIGENGSDFDPKPDSKITPGGIYLAGKGFYIGEKPDTTYPLFQITDNTYWVTDPKSKFYNQQVEGTDKKDWSKADHMITSDKSYKYGLVINFNTTSPDKNKACGIFFHCGSSATEGSIALPENVMKTILEWLDEDSKVSVFVTI